MSRTYNIAGVLAEVESPYLVGDGEGRQIWKGEVNRKGRKNRIHSLERRMGPAPTLQRILLIIFIF
jgi:hypothetical protein